MRLRYVLVPIVLFCIAARTRADTVLFASQTILLQSNGTAEPIYVRIFLGRRYATEWSDTPRYLEAGKQVRNIQTLAVRHILESSTSQDRKILRRHLKNLPALDEMVVLSKSGKFETIDSSDIVGTISISAPNRSPKLLEARPAPSGKNGIRVSGFDGSLFSLDQKWTLRHLVSLDPAYTPLLLQAADATVFRHPKQVKADNPMAIVQFGSEKMSLAEFTRRWASESKSIPVLPEFYQMDAFDVLRDYYEKYGFREDTSIPSHGNLHHYDIDRDSLFGLWVRGRAGKIAPRTSFDRQALERLENPYPVTPLWRSVFLQCLLNSLVNSPERLQVPNR